MQIVRNWARAPRIFGNSITGPVFVLSFVHARALTHTRIQTHTHTHTHTRDYGDARPRATFPASTLRTEQNLRKFYSLLKLWEKCTQPSDRPCVIQNQWTVDFHAFVKIQRFKKYLKTFSEFNKVSFHFFFFFLNYVYKNIKTHKYSQSIRGNFTTTSLYFLPTTSKWRNLTLNSKHFVFRFFQV